MEAQKSLAIIPHLALGRSLLNCCVGSPTVLRFVSCRGQGGTETRPARLEYAQRIARPLCLPSTCPEVAAKQLVGIFGENHRAGHGL